MTYSEKLRDPRWQKLRLQIMERDQFRCRRCGSKTKTLNVHHGYYQKGASPWDYPNDALVTVCEDCHSEMESLRTHILRETTNPHAQRIIATCCDAMGSLPSVYPKTLALFMDAVEEFITASEFWECDPNEDPADCSVAIDTAAMFVNRAMVEVKAAWIAMARKEQEQDEADAAAKAP